MTSRLCHYSIHVQYCLSEPLSAYCSNHHSDLTPWHESVLSGQEGATCRSLNATQPVLLMPCICTAVSIAVCAVHK